ncbi:helix-turn-helix transcriptional regulator [Mucilaginibacter corticis]|uniref:Helix-turn-helix transcriptional regulator n=1 Tax=Mucilaginibacter corticis TaxID=2597670 RepID=A0A556MX12_9SPHI|nr:AraC family transcriptional regulator [Mucilaginibacter corticis]TSJ44447.1 helix-turn-helix transcriptional regulator [Mucilaginibacter corticis]
MFVNLLFIQFLTSFLFNERLSATQKVDSDDFLDKSVGFMQGNLDKALALTEIADFLNYSVSHFSFRFKNKTSFSPIEYFNDLKIQKACQYLRFTELRVKEIAEKIDFEDAFYFSRLFTGVMGSSPRAYRNSFVKVK